MKTFITALVLAGVAIAGPASARMCIDTRDIVSSKSDDGKVMVFEMKNGQTLVNKLRGQCPDLKYNGFVWQLRSGDTMVCENAQSFQVIQSGQICVLGAFDPVASKQAMSKPPVDANKTVAPR